MDNELRNLGNDILDFAAGHYCKAPLSPLPLISIAATLVHGVHPNNQHMREALEYLTQIHAPTQLIVRIRHIDNNTPHSN